MSTEQESPMATFSYVLNRARTGYRAEGVYPNVTPEQYKAIVHILEGWPNISIEKIAEESLRGSKVGAGTPPATSPVNERQKPTPEVQAISLASINILAKQYENKAILDVIEERLRQIKKKGYDKAHDDEHDGGELAASACAYALAAADKLHPQSQGDGDYKEKPPAMWPWDEEAWKPGNARRMLVKAAALVLAEIDRIDRRENQSNEKRA